MNIVQIIADYLDIKNVWKVAELHNTTGQKIHTLLNKNNIDTSNKYKWTKDQIEELKEIYNKGFIKGDNYLNLFCEKHNKLKSNVCRKAKLLGLKTNSKRGINDEIKRVISKNTKEHIETKGHPKGFLNGKHSMESKSLMSEASKKAWKDPNNKVNSKEYRQTVSDRQSALMRERLTNGQNVHSKSKKGTIEIGGKKVFCRSSWEANMCAYFQFLKDNNQIKDWDLEPNTFWFDKIKRGVRSYKPDFLITNIDGSQYYEEVKGWMDAKSKTKIKRMAKYYPQIDLRILDQKRYKEISKMKSIIPNWGMLG